MNLIPHSIFLTKGVGVHKEKLASFELALRKAGMAHLNLVSVSSIFPPDCKIVSKERGLRALKPGQVVFCVYARSETNEYRRLVASSVGVSIPKDPSRYGYLSEYHGYGVTGGTAADYAEDLAAEMLATTLGVDFDPDASWDEKKDQWKISGEIYKTTNITQTATGSKNGLWTTVLAAAVLVMDPIP